MLLTNQTAAKLFQPSKIGDITLGHRVVLAPLTRCRANSAHVHGDLAVEYYAQRASIPGTLLIAEGTFIAPQAGGLHLGPNVPGIWNEEQIAAWKRVRLLFTLIRKAVLVDLGLQVVDAVHARGSFIYLQLWALGRAADVEQLKAENPDFPHIAPSAIPLKDSKGTPRALTISGE